MSIHFFAKSPVYEGIAFEEEPRTLMKNSTTRADVEPRKWSKAQQKKLAFNLAEMNKVWMVHAGAPEEIQILRGRVIHVIEDSCIYSLMEGERMSREKLKATEKIVKDLVEQGVPTEETIAQQIRKSSCEQKLTVEGVEKNVMQQSAENIFALLEKAQDKKGFFPVFVDVFLGLYEQRNVAISSPIHRLLCERFSPYRKLIANKTV